MGTGEEVRKVGTTSARRNTFGTGSNESHVISEKGGASRGGHGK